MDGVETFLVGLAQATAVVKQVRPEHFANSTPDTEWNVRDLAGHMLYELKWVPDLLAGMTVEEVGDAYEGDLIDDDVMPLSASWQETADIAEAAANAADPDEPAHLSYGDIPNDAYLKEVGGDLLIHAWDLGKAIGIVVQFPNDIAEAVYETTIPKRPALQASGLFGPELPVIAKAPIQTKLLALFGRDADWQP